MTTSSKEASSSSHTLRRLRALILLFGFVAANFYYLPVSLRVCIFLGCLIPSFLLLYGYKTKSHTLNVPNALYIILNSVFFSTSFLYFPVNFSICISLGCLITNFFFLLYTTKSLLVTGASILVMTVVTIPDVLLVVLRVILYVALTGIFVFIPVLGATILGLPFTFKPIKWLYDRLIPFTKDGVGNKQPNELKARTVTPKRKKIQRPGKSNGRTSSGVGSDKKLDQGGDESVDGCTIGKLFVSHTEIAKGSNGTIVLEGTHEVRRVAVKRLVKAYHDVADKEYQNLCVSDRHSNIVRLYGVEEDQDFMYLALERCTGSLNDLIQMHLLDAPTTNGEQATEVNIEDKVRLQSMKGTLPEDKLWEDNGYPSPTLWKLMRDMVSGLVHLHELGMVHRDLKPQNVLISKERSLCAKLSDMGISKRLVEDMSSLGHHATELGPISKTLNSQARQSACEEILAQAVRHAPTLLDYVPSYKGVLKKKEKKKKEDGEPAEKGKRKRSSGQSDEAARKKKKAASEGVQTKRTKGVRLPKIGYTAAEWLTPLCAEETQEEMSRRNIPRPPIPTKPLNPAVGRGSAEQQQKEKRQKSSHDHSIPSVSKAIQVVDSATDPKEKELLESPQIDLTENQAEEAILRPFSPSYTMRDGRILLLKDSVKEEPNLAVTLLRGLALPRDCEQVPSDLMPNLAEMCSNLVQAGQAALKAYDKAEKVHAERERFRVDRDNYKAKWKASVKEVKEVETELGTLKKELAESKAAAATAEALVKKLQGEEQEKVRQADLKGYEAGILRASMEYTRTAYKMVNEALEGRLPDFFRRGYASGAQEMAGVLAIQADSGFLKQLPEPIVPDLDLPYTEEECAPLPPEEDEDAEMAEASQKGDPAVAEDFGEPTEADGHKEVAAVENP